MLTRASYNPVSLQLTQEKSEFHIAIHKSRKTPSWHLSRRGGRRACLPQAGMAQKGVSFLPPGVVVTPHPCALSYSKIPPAIWSKRPASS